MALADSLQQADPWLRRETHLPTPAAAAEQQLACPVAMSAQPTSTGPWPLKDPHFKDVARPARYSGAAQNWTDLSTEFRRFLAARDYRFGFLLDAIETLQRKLVTVQDEATWEQCLQLEPHIENFADQLNMYLENCTT